jgi:hypothetical protein
MIELAIILVLILLNGVSHLTELAVDICPAGETFVTCIGL